jgi:sterol desaturase/sphingolipid hydroxylase (fatty acid hydroxylase superfamily)
MEYKKSTQKRFRNPDTYIRFRSEVFRQITIPVVISLSIILALAVLAIYPATALQDSLWADIALIFLILPVFLILILMIFILAISVYLTTWMIKELPAYFYQAYHWLSLANEKIQTMGSAITEPFIRFHSFLASMNELGEKISRKS